MFWHVYERARRSPLSGVTLATDDARIAEAAKALNVPFVMTRPDHPCGTDRVYEAATKLGLPDDAVVVNIQGDEPLLDPLLLVELTAPFGEENVEVATPAAVISAERAASPNQVKVVTDVRGNALYFSRSPIPFPRDDAVKHATEYLGHIGLYAFRMRTLRRFVTLPQSPLEQLEKLEQLRLIENGIPIRVVRTARHVPGVDTPEDLERIRQVFALKAEPRDI